jgi:lipoate---protein ligase
MITEALLYRTESLDPYRNIALEEYFLETAERGTCLLYLWQNERTVVVGRNQDCRRECRVSELESDGGHLARRISGGGAVFHDLGNLNFTFVARADDYDPGRQFDVILGAVTSLGIPAEKSGRNDLTAGGRKFSGNAFFRSADRAFHHGTILVRADLAGAARYLGAEGGKFASRTGARGSPPNGVASKPSPMVNLSEFVPALSVDDVALALARSFGAVCGREVKALPPTKIDWFDVNARRSKFASPDWKYNRSIRFTRSFSGRYPWGGVEFYLDARDGVVVDLDVISDAMDHELAPAIAGRIRGMPFDPAIMALAVADLARSLAEETRPAIADVSALILAQRGA